MMKNYNINLKLLFTVLALIIFNIFYAQVANQPSPFELCDDDTADGFTEFDLSIKNAEILGSQSSSDFSVSYYLTQIDADNDVNQLPILFTNLSNPQTLFVRVEDLNTSSFDTTAFTIEVFSKPELISIFRTFVFDGSNTFDLTSFEEDFTVGDNSILIYRYYLNLSDANNQVNPIDPIDFNQSGWVFVRAINTIAGCVSDARALQFAMGEITELSSVNSSVSDSFCYGTIDTYTYYEFVNTDGGVVTLNFSSGQVEDGWDELVVIDSNGTTNLNLATPYGNLGDISGLTYQSSSNRLSFYIQSADNLYNCDSENYTPISFNISIDNSSTIVINQPSPFELCDDEITDGFTEFDLSIKNAEILGSQSSSDFSVSYYLTQIDADNDVNQLPILFTNLSNPQTLFVRVEDLNTSSFDTTTLILRVLTNPEPGIPSDIVVCDDDTNDGFADFDLTVNDLLILNGELGNSVSYYNTESDALFGSNVIDNPAMYININTSYQTIYARLENDVFGCFAITNFDLIVNPQPIDIALNNYTICETNSDGFAAFDLETKVSEILNTQVSSDFSVSFHESQMNADNQVNALVSPYVNIANPQTIFIAVTNVINGCISTEMSFNIQVLNNIQVNPDGIPLLYEICDDNIESDSDLTNDSASFDLNSLNSDVLDGQDPTNVNIDYYGSEADANLGINPLPMLYNNITNPQIIYTRVTNMQCFEVAPVTLLVNSLPPLNLEDEYDVCNGETLILETSLSQVEFNFTWTQNGSILSGETASQLAVTQNGMYGVIITSVSSGCFSQDMTVVNVIDCTDTDSDGVIDSDEDLNGNGNLDDDDTDLDMIPNYMDDDDDGDNVDTNIEINIATGRMPNHPFIDTDMDTIENYLDNDDDGDLVLTINEDYNNNGDPTDDDTNMNLMPDYLEIAVALSLSEFDFSGFGMFPSPASDILNIKLNNITNAELSIYDIQGKLVLKNSISGQELELNVSDLQSGLYFVKLNTNTKEFVKKLVIE